MPGLACEDGIVVDQNAPHRRSRISGRPATAPAMSGAKATRSAWNACRTPSTRPSMRRWRMVGKPKTYSEVPWFWSDQYDLKLQIAGLARPTDTLVLRGDPAARKFAVFHLRDGAVAAVEAVNAAPEYMIGKKLIAEGATIAPERLADTVHSHEADGLMAPQIQSHLHRGQTARRTPSRSPKAGR